MCEVDNILTDWGLESLVATFRDNKIDLETFKKLTPKYVVKLIPTIGDQIIFEEKWNSKYATFHTPPPAVRSSNDQFSNTKNDVRIVSPGGQKIPLKTLDDKSNKENDGLTEEDLLSVSNKAVRNGSSKTVDTSDTNSSVTKPATSSQSIEIKRETVNKQNSNAVPKGRTLADTSGSEVVGSKKSKSLSISTDTDTDSEKENQHTKKKLKKSHRRSIKEEKNSESDIDSNSSSRFELGGKRKAFIGHKQFKKRITEEDTLSVTKILKQSAAGKCLLAGYEKNNRLTSKFRKILVDLIISANVIDENSVLRRDQFDYLSSEIVELFPTESKESYYIPPVPKHLSRFNKSEVARGKLVDKFRNKIKQYRLLAGVSRQKKGKKDIPKDAQLTDEVETSIQWLKHNGDAPFNDMLDHWERTTLYRWHKLKDSDTSIADHLKEWPILTKSDGHKLIEAEFRLLWKHQGTVIYTRWAEFFNKMRNLRCLTNPNSKLLESIIDDETSTENCKILAQIQLLPYYVPPKGRIQRERQHWKPSITECQESMLIHVKEAGDITKAQKDKVEKMVKHGLTVQPYILAVGPTLQEVKDYYVAIDQTLYRFDSPLKALNVCFKSFHVLNAVYPPESEHIYLLIQWAVYDFTTDWDKTISYIMDIVRQVKE